MSGGSEPVEVPPNVFVGYRRDDVPDVVGRMHDRLVDALGWDAVFKDVDDLPLGEEFGPYIRERFARCDASSVAAALDDAASFVTACDRVVERWVRERLPAVLHRTVTAAWEA